jgi:anti-anti-sigma regulatory factor
VTFREHHLGDVVHQIDAVGEMPEQAAPELDRRLHAAMEHGARWLIVDLAEALNVADGVLGVLLAAARDLHMRKGELILAGASPAVVRRLEETDLGRRPALAAGVDQALIILKMLRPKTTLEAPASRAKQRISSLSLPRIEPA